MFYSSNHDNKYFYIRCEKCDEEHKILKTSVIDYENGSYWASDTISCTCGNSSKLIKNKKPSPPKIKPVIPPANNAEVTCPKCGSNQISANKKGFGLVKGVAGGIALTAVGGIALGGVGLLGGFAGKNKVEITCIRCGYHWLAGKK